VLVIDTVVLRLLFPTAAVGVALLGEAHGWGLLNPLGLPAVLALALVSGVRTVCLPARPDEPVHLARASLARM
jgi:hypothetical protein